MEQTKNVKRLVTSKCTVYLIPSNDGDVKGKIFSEYYNSTFNFENDFEMLLGIEDMLNSLNFPQPCFKERKFEHSNKRQIIEKVDQAVDEETNNSEEKFKTTFIVDVMYRKNASWQGTITWVEKNQTQQFRSALEMLKLMEQANSGETTKIIKWEKR